MKKLLLPFFILTLYTFLYPQSSTQHRTYGLLDANRVKTVFSNYGVVAQPNSIKPRGAWKYNNNGYFGDFSLVVGLELPIKDYTGDGTPDTLHGVVVTAASRPGGGKSNQDGTFCGFEPLPGYNNSNAPVGKGIALSDDPSTWPPFWPDHPEYPGNSWAGLLGLNTFIPGREALFAMDDANEKRKFDLYGFLPDSTNPTRKGFGLDVRVRIIQSTLPELQDALIYVYDIKNNSKHTYNKMVLGELTGSYIGGDGAEWDDDYTVLYNKDDMILTGDFDNRINPNSNPNWIGKAGMFGNAFIQSPGRQKIGSFNYFAPSGDIRLGDDEDMWKRLKPGRRVSPWNIIYNADSTARVILGEDSDHMYGTHWFSLSPGESKRIVSVLAYGYSQNEIYDKILSASAMYYNNFDKAQIASRLSLTSHMNNPLISGTSSIEWQSSIPNTGTVDIYYSPDKGLTWKNIVYNAPNSGTFTWNTTGMDDSKFAMLRIVLKDADENKVAVIKSKTFALNNTVNGAPYFSFDNIDEGQEINTIFYNLEVTTADPENSSLNLKLYAKNNATSDSVLVLTKELASDTVRQTVRLNIGLIPNTERLILIGFLSDGQNNRVVYTDEFKKLTQSGYLNNSHFGYTSGNTSVQVKIRIADSSLIKSHSYTITFDDTIYLGKPKLYSVWNNDRNSFVLKDKKLYANGESEMFDGMFFQTNDFITWKDTLRSHWQTGNTNGLPHLKFNASFLPFYKCQRSPKDYMFVFSDVYTDSSNNLSHLLQGVSAIYSQLNYKVFDITNGIKERIKFAHFGAISGSCDTLNNYDVIALSNKSGSVLSWILNFDGSDTSYIPKGGDTLFFYTNKGLSIYDTLRINNLTVGVSSGLAPLTFDVSHNYPNPFNPTTRVAYAVPQRSMVTVQIYNMLGQLIKTAVQSEHQPGNYTVDLNMKGFASGIYLYRVSIGNKSVTRKMLLLK